MKENKRAKEIYEILVDANKKYRNGSEIMSDEEFDKLEDELRGIDPENEWFKAGVNDETPSSRKFKLPYPMMSLDKVKNFKSLREWADRFPGATFIVTPKFDGLSVGFDNKRAWTRGDGTIGQDCTRQIQKAHLFGSKDNVFDSLADGKTVRGEIIFSNRFGNWDSFKKIHPEAKSQRNSATGLINGDYDEGKDDEYSLLSIMPYEIQNSGLSKAEQLFRSGACYKYLFLDRNGLTEETLKKYFFAESKNYPMDGVVIDVNEPEYRHGNEANGNPSYTIAYKHPSFSEVGETKVYSIGININRDGIATPVVHISPELTLSGATISKVNGINMRYINDWKIFPGETIEVIRSGEVIPKIVSVGGVVIPFKELYNDPVEYRSRYSARIEKRADEYSGKFGKELEMSCPYCGKKLEKSGGEDYVNYICNNDDCDGKKEQKIIKFFEICGLEGFKEAKIKQLIDSRKIKDDFFDAFYLTREDLSGLEGWGEKSIDSFIEKLGSLRKGTVSFARFLHATGYFEDLGEKTLQIILDNVETPEHPDVNELMSIEGVQRVTAEKYLSGMRKYAEKKEEIGKLFIFSNVRTMINNKKGKLSGQVICFSGFRNKVLAKMVEDNGGTMVDSVTKNTTMLVIGSLSGLKSAKAVKAEKLGIEINTESDFCNYWFSE